jgi:putative RecB family exonuclease
MAIYSHSKLSSFEQCPLKYKYRYIDKIKVEVEDTIESFLGSRVHDTLEWLYKTKKEKDFIPKIEEIINYFEKIWVKDYKEGIRINSGLSLRDYFEKGKKLIKDYYEKNYPFEEETIALEERVYLDLDENNNYKIQGFIDRLAYNKENQEYEIHDYKTTKSMKAEEELHEDRQLALYALALKQKYKDAKTVALIWHFLNFNRDFRIYQTQEKLEKIKKEVIELIKKIESTSEFPANPSALCGWCEFQDICPKFKEIQLNGSGNVSKINANIDKEKQNKVPNDEKILVDKYCELSNQENKNNEEIQNLKDALINYAKAKNSNMLFGNKSKISIKNDEIQVWDN